MLPRLAGLSSTLLSGGAAETHSGSGVWLVFSLRTLVCPDGICGRVRTFVVTRVPCSVVNSLFAHSTHTDASKGPAPPAESARVGPTPDIALPMSAWQRVPAQVSSHNLIEVAHQQPATPFKEPCLCCTQLLGET